MNLIKKLFNLESKKTKNPCTEKLQEYVKKDPTFKYPEKGTITENIGSFEVITELTQSKAKLISLIELYENKLEVTHPHHSNIRFAGLKLPDYRYGHTQCYLEFKGDRPMNDEEYEAMKSTYLREWERFQKLKLKFS